MSHESVYFHTNLHNTILFEQWTTMTWQELLGSCIGIAILAALYEGFKVGREYLAYQMSNDEETKENRTRDEDTGERNTTHEEISTRTDEDSTVISMGDDEFEKTKRRPKMLSMRHLVQTGLHFVQLWIGYCLMLVFMTASVYLCVAIIVGAAVGYFCFAWMRPTSLHSTYSRA